MRCRPTTARGSSSPSSSADSTSRSRPVPTNHHYHPFFDSFSRSGLTLLIVIADCPLELPQTSEPLVEEYSIAAQVRFISLLGAGRPTRT
jgi:hypothetical protein